MRQKYFLVRDETFILQETDIPNMLVFYRDDYKVLEADYVDDLRRLYQQYIAIKETEDDVVMINFSNKYYLSEDRKFVKLVVDEKLVKSKNKSKSLLYSFIESLKRFIEE